MTRISNVSMNSEFLPLMGQRSQELGEKGPEIETRDERLPTENVIEKGPKK